MLKHFKFFSSSLLSDENGAADTPNTFFESLDVSCCSSGSNHVVFGDAQGGVTLVNRGLQPRRFNAHDIRVNLIHQLETREVLVTLGDGRDQRTVAVQKQSRDISIAARARLRMHSVEYPFADEESTPVSSQSPLKEDLNASPVIKIWKHDRLDAYGFPQCVRSISLNLAQLGEKNLPPWGEEAWPAATCMDVSEDLSHVVIGLANGFSFVLLGDIERDKGHIQCVTLPPPSFQVPASDRPSLSPASLAFRLASVEKAQAQSSGSKPWFPPVTGLALDTREPEPRGAPARSYWVWVASGREASDEPAAASMPSGGVRSFQISTDLRANAWLQGLDPKAVKVLAGPLLDDEGCPRNTCTRIDMRPSPQTRSGARQQAGHATKRTVFFAVGKPDQIKYFTPEDPGACYAIGGKKRYLAGFQSYLVVAVSPQKSVAAQTTIQNLTAGSSNQRTGRETFVSGDQVYIYDFQNKLVAMHINLTPDDGQVQFVVHQWGSIFVVTSTHRIFRLTERDLETKLSDLCSRMQFPTAVALARGAGCDTSTVLDIVRRYGDHLYSKGRYEEAVSQYTRTIGYVGPSYVIRKFLEAQRIESLTAYLEALHQNPAVQPSEDLTTLLLSCYTKQRDETKLFEFIHKHDVTFDIDAAISVLRRAKYFEEAMHLATTHLQTALRFEILVNDLSQYAEAIQEVGKLFDFEEAFTIAKDYGLQFMKAHPENACALFIRLCDPDNWNVAVDQPDIPNLFSGLEGSFSHPHQCLSEVSLFMVDFPREHFRLVESVMKVPRAPLAGVTEKMWNLFLQLALSLRQQVLEGPEHSGEKSRYPSIEALEESAMGVLRDPTAKYDTNQALMLVKAFDFTPGKLFLFEKLGLLQLLVEHYMKAGDYGTAIEKCKVFGNEDPNLWVFILDAFAIKSGNEHAEEISEILAHIQEYDLVPPLLVVQILSKNPDLPLEVALEYLTEQLGTTKALVEQDKDEIEQLQKETDEMSARVHSLVNEPQVFRNTKCGLSGAPLEQPTVHFLSGNSYNLTSLPTAEIGDIKDPKREAEQQAVAHYVTGLKKRNSQGVDEEFLREMEVSTDGFRTIAEYFGKCLFTDL